MAYTPKTYQMTLGQKQSQAAGRAGARADEAGQAHRRGSKHYYPDFYMAGYEDEKKVIAREKTQGREPGSLRAKFLAAKERQNAAGFYEVYRNGLYGNFAFKTPHGLETRPTKKAANLAADLWREADTRSPNLNTYFDRKVTTEEELRGLGNPAGNRERGACPTGPTPGTVLKRISIEIPGANKSQEIATEKPDCTDDNVIFSDDIPTWKQYEEMAQMGAIDDEDNPIFLFSGTRTMLLQAIIDGSINPVALAKKEISKRIRHGYREASRRG